MLKLTKLVVLAAAIALPAAGYAASPQSVANGKTVFSATTNAERAGILAPPQRGSVIVNSINARRTITSGVNPEG